MRITTITLTLLAAAAAVTRADEREPLRRAPTVAAFDVKRLPRAEQLATPPVRTLLGYTRRVLQLPDGHTLAVFSYSNSAPANWMFLIDARDLTSKRVAIPNNDIASHAAALGSDGNVYVMPYHTGRAYRFDVAKGAFEPIAVNGLPDGEYTWDAIGGTRDGCIYFGTYPGACLGRYDTKTGETRVWPNVAPGTRYVTNFEHDTDGAGGVRFKAWGPDEVWMRVDAKSDAPKRIDPPKDSAAPPVGAPDAEMPEPSWTVRAGDNEVTIGHFGSLKRRGLGAKSGSPTRAKLDNLAPGGNAIMFLEAVTPDCVVGANYSQQHLFRINPKTGDVRVSDDMVARTTGQPELAVALNGKAYVGHYIRAIVSEFDPAKPFKFADNPREVGELFTQHHQTRPAEAVTDGRLVFASTEGDYNRLGGALAVYDPQAKRFDAYAGIVRDQNLTSLAYDPKNRVVWGGTSRWGQMRSVPPTQPSAVLYAFDPQSRKVVATLTPWPGADDIAVVGCTDDGTVIATSGGAVAHVDGASRNIVFLGAWPFPPSKLRRGADRSLYALSGGTLLRWELKDNTFHAIGQAPAGCAHFTESSPGTWLFADATTVYRLRVVD